MTDLPTRYAALVARRLELAVDGLAWFVGTHAAWTDADGRMDPDACPAMWTIHENGPFMYAHALILTRLVEALPMGASLHVSMFDATRKCYAVEYNGMDGWHESPIEAVFSFLEAQ